MTLMTVVQLARRSNATIRWLQRPSSPVFDALLAAPRLLACS